MTKLWNDSFVASPDKKNGLWGYTGAYINDFRVALAERLSVEHNFNTSEAAPQANHGMHKAGTAIAYRQSTAPTYRPNGITPLDSDDIGRLWCKHSGDAAIHCFDGSEFIGIPITLSQKMFNDTWRFSEAYAEGGDFPYGTTGGTGTFMDDTVLGDLYDTWAPYMELGVIYALHGSFTVVRLDDGGSTPTNKWYFGMARAKYAIKQYSVAADDNYITLYGTGYDGYYDSAFGPGTVGLYSLTSPYLEFGTWGYGSYPALAGNTTDGCLAYSLYLGQELTIP